RRAPRFSVEHQPVAMHGFETARAGGQLVRTRTRDALAEGDPVRPDELDRRTGLEPALAADDAYTEQARALVHERRLRALVDVQRADDRLAKTKPELEGGRSSLVRIEACSPHLAGDDRPQHLLAEPAGDHG